MHSLDWKDYHRKKRVVAPKNFSYLSEFFTDGDKPVKVYIYPGFDGENEQQSWHYPHVHIDRHFIWQLRGSSMLVDDIEEADVAYIPLFLDSWYFLTADLENRPNNTWDATMEKTWDIMAETWDTKWEPQLASKEIRRKVPHFIIWSYVMYRSNFHFLPRDIHILAYENYGVTGEPDDISYDNGCADRCIVIPYPTFHSWAGGYDGQSYFSSIQGKVNLKSFLKRNFITMIGSMNRSTTLKRYREKPVRFLQKAYPKSFKTAKGEVHSKSNALIYRKSRFCIQLPGDTPTRNGFYESLLEGCTPIIYESSLNVYGMLYGGCLPISDMVIALPDSIWNANSSLEVIRTILDEADQREPTRQRLIAMSRFRKFFNYQEFEIYGVSLPIFASLKAVAGRVKRVRKEPLIYVYDIPPRFNYDLLSNGILMNDQSADWRESLFDGAYGPPIQRQVDGFSKHAHVRRLTSQYALEPIAHLQVMNHPRRTVIKEQADLAVLPLYTFLSGHYSNHFDHQSIAKKYMELLKWVRWDLSPIPHVIFYGDVLWNTPPHFPQNALVKIPKNTYFIALEEDTKAYSFMKKNAISKDLVSGLGGRGKVLNDSHVIAVPYPTSFHHSNRYGKINLVPNPNDREFLICYAGGDRWPVSGLEKAREQGLFAISEFQYLKVDFQGWTTTHNESDITQILDLYSKCWFTLQPHAGMGTRRGFYDSLSTGSIPVLFKNNANRYNHLFKGLYSSTNISLLAVTLELEQEGDPIENEKQDIAFAQEIIKQLKAISIEERRKKQHFIYENMASFQYSLYYDPEDALNLALNVVSMLDQEQNH